MLADWQLSGILLFETGPFLTPTIDARTDQSGTNMTSRAADRPDYTVASYGNLGSGTVDAWFDRNAFSIPASRIGRFGYVGPGQLVGPAPPMSPPKCRRR